ncbi:Hypothetical predicted protein [Paramuricea clavata]|uniref:Uncharacterized protein n=1 Tax=Paramuricea clavata TaxID=317549 RepID=A0A6S7FTJ8_PARCT|nr:Hypothetical predicted protein [Paramuricea clavata]
MCSQMRRCRITILLVITAYGIFDCVSDWQLYFERNEQIENICKKTRETEIRDSTQMALTAMFVFVIFGTILVVFEAANSVLTVREQPIMHPVILSIVVCVLEELPLAGLRWNLKTSANNKMADGWGITSGILGITAPLLGPMVKCCKKSGYCSADEEKTCCDELCSGGCGICDVCLLFFMAIGTVVINSFNWAGVKAPGAELCV